MIEAEKILNDYGWDECLQRGGSWECLGWEVGGVEEKMLNIVAGQRSGDDIGVLSQVSETCGGASFEEGC